MNRGYNTCTSGVEYAAQAPVKQTGRSSTCMMVSLVGIRSHSINFAELTFLSHCLMLPGIAGLTAEHSG